jgi:hypothetical protein
VFKTDFAGQIYIDFGDAALISAYVAALTDLASVPGFRDRVRYLSLGNEVGTYLVNQSIAPLWAAYTKFCQDVSAELRSKKLLPRTLIGINWQIQHILGTGGQPSYLAAWKLMSEVSDALFINFYPAAGSTEYEVHFQQMLDLSSAHGAGKQIVLQEIGMPSSEFVGSSEGAQDVFLGFVLDQWEKAGLLIPFLSWFQLYDLLYDETLLVAVNPATHQIEVLTSKYPKTLTYYGKDAGPFWGAGHNLAQFFFGPLIPGKPPGPITSDDTAFWLNESTKPGYRAFCEYFATCGLICANGRVKPAGKTFLDRTNAQRRQT